MSVIHAALRRAGRALHALLRGTPPVVPPAALPTPIHSHPVRVRPERRIAHVHVRRTVRIR